MGFARRVIVAAAAAVLVAGCFDPDVVEGLACGADGECPPDQFCDDDGVCRRESEPPDFDAAQRIDAAITDTDAAEKLDGALPDAPSGSPDAGSPDAAISQFCSPTANSDLVACFRFDNSVIDASGGGHTPTVAVESYATGVTDAAFSFTSASDMLIAESAALDMPQLTIEMWLFVTAIGATDITVVDNNNQYELEVSTTAKLRTRCSIGGTNHTVLGNATLTTGTFHHVAVTYDGSQLALWIDGNLDNSTPATGTLATANTGGTFIGKDHTDSEFLTGRIDDLRIFSSARSAAQICAAAGGNGC